MAPDRKRHSNLNTPYSFRRASQLSQHEPRPYPLEFNNPPPSAPLTLGPWSITSPLSASTTISSSRSQPSASQEPPDPRSSRQQEMKCLLEGPLAISIEFATWLESQHVAQSAPILRAVERDGKDYLHLARVSIAFEKALLGHQPPPTSNSSLDLLREHARTLRDFASLLKSKLSENSLSEDLKDAVLRDGKGLLRLARSCLDFDRVVRGLNAGASAGAPRSNCSCGICQRSLRCTDTAT